MPLHLLLPLAILGSRALVKKLSEGSSRRSYNYQSEHNAVYSKSTRNVVIFGESGAGKSSVVNMILGEDQALVSSSAAGCTFESTAYGTTINGLPFTLYDTTGLNEVTTLSHSDAVLNLKSLIYSLTDGVSLLVYVVRGPRVKQFIVDNYKLFYETCCQEKVPIVLVVTGLEHEDPMDDWWIENRGVFDQHGMFFSGVACVAATKGRYIWQNGYAFAEEYEESTEKVRSLVWTACL